MGKEDAEGEGDDGCIRYQSVVSPSFRELGTREKLWFESRRRGGEGALRVTSRSRYTFSITRWIYSWHPVLRLTSSSPGCIGEKPDEATRGIPPRQLPPPPPPPSSFHFNNRYEVSGSACEKPRARSSSLFRSLEMPLPIIISIEGDETRDFFQLFLGYFLELGFEI